MFDAPVDTLYVWIGLGAVSLAVAGTVLAFPTASPAGAPAVADGIDAVAASDHQARTRIDLSASEMRLGPRTVSLRADGTTAHARLTFGPVTPVRDGKLRAVLGGRPPGAVFEDTDAFARAIDDARRRDEAWRPAPERLTVCQVSWGDVDATLLG